MSKRKFNKEELLEALQGDSAKYETVVNEIDGTSRWSATYTYVFQELETGKFYRTWYNEGLTEYQDESPWEYEDEIQATEVEPVEVTVVKYQAVVPF